MVWLKKKASQKKQHTTPNTKVKKITTELHFITGNPLPLSPTP